MVLVGTPRRATENLAMLSAAGMCFERQAFSRSPDLKPGLFLFLREFF
jgi:hypothetical protein